MLSLGLRSTLEREIVGQPRALATVVRTLTVAMAGLANPASPLGIYLFVGPSGTGKTHMARSVAELLHDDPRKVVVLDCVQLAGRDDWGALAQQLAPYFRYPAGEQGGESVLTMGPLSILLVEHLEWARPEMVQALVTAIETGYLVLPDGKCGSLSGCLVLMTSNLCAREIYDAGRPEIGFSPAKDIEETEKARIYQLVSTAVEKHWGTDFLSHLDDLLVFHRLREDHLPFILKRMMLQINERLASRQISCELDGQAADFILTRGARYLRHGAWILVRVFRRFVLFPIADLAHSGHIPAGSKVLVALDPDDRLRFEIVSGRRTTPRAVVELEEPLDIPVQWDEPVGSGQPDAVA